MHRISAALGREQLGRTADSAASREPPSKLTDSVNLPHNGLLVASSREPSQLADGAWRFELVESAGRGTTSEVWKARDRLTGALVALKIARGQEGAAILAREAERLA